MKRRHFLRGLAGAFIALPALEALSPSRRGAKASTPSSRFALFFRQGNGVQQATPSGEPERFWPTFAPGALSQAQLASDSGRALSVLAAHAERLLVVRGIRFNDPANPCRHSGGGNQVLTAASVSKDDCNSTLALGPSIDTRIAASLGAANVNEEPLTVYAGRKTGYLDEVLSYREARALRAAVRDPAIVYGTLFGVGSASADEAARVQARRTSVNDLVRDELQAFLRRTDLSGGDRKRLDQHLSSIRDVETGISCLPATDAARFSVAATALDDDDQIETIIKLHCDLLTLGVSCGAVRAATLQIGCGPDQTRYWIDGARQRPFHEISHRQDIPDAALLHSKIDRKLLGLFQYLLDGLAGVLTPTGSLLDQGVVAYVNDLATGDHSYENVPYILAGSGGGYLKQGLYVDAGGVTNNKILNTIGAAAGCTNAAGGPLDDFGDPSLAKGLLPELVASSAQSGG